MRYLSIMPLLMGIAVAPPGIARERMELPGGGGPEFRARMMEWSLPRTMMNPAMMPVPERTAAQDSIGSSGAGSTLPRLSSRFGYRRDPIKGNLRMHSGIDMPGPLGSPVLASGPGMVSFAGDAGGYGNMVEITHGGGFDTRYGHLHRILVHPGTRVTQGQLIGLMGSTGRSTGSHLHFEIRQAGRPLDPAPLLTDRRRLAGSVANGGISPGVVFERTQPHISAFAVRRDKAAMAPGEAK